MYIFRQGSIDFLEGTNRCLQGTSVVVAIERVEKRSILTYQSDFGCGGSGIDSQESVAMVIGEITFYHLVRVMSLHEGIVGCFICDSILISEESLFTISSIEKLTFSSALRAEPIAANR